MDNLKYHLLPLTCYSYQYIQMFQLQTVRSYSYIKVLMSYSYYRDILGLLCGILRRLYDPLDKPWMCYYKLDCDILRRCGILRRL